LLESENGDLEHKEEKMAYFGDAEKDLSFSLFGLYYFPEENN